MFGVYPSLIGGLVLIGHQWHATGGMLMGVGVAVVALLTYIKISHALNTRWREQKLITAAIREVDPASGEYQLLLESAFRLFDADDSGQIDIYELRELLHLVYKQFDRFQMSEMVHRLRTQTKSTTFSAEGKVEFADFVEIMHNFRRMTTLNPALKKQVMKSGLSRRLFTSGSSLHAGRRPSTGYMGMRGLTAFMSRKRKTGSESTISQLPQNSQWVGPDSFSEPAAASALAPINLLPTKCAYSSTSLDC